MFDEATEITTETRKPYDQVVAPADGDETSSSSSSSCEEDGQATVPTSELQDRYLAIVDTINRLYAQSIAIESSALRNRNSKAASYTEKDEYGNDISELFESYAFERLRREYPEAADFLISRLVASVSQRRRQFMYVREGRRLPTQEVPSADTLPPTQSMAQEISAASDISSLSPSSGIRAWLKDYDSKVGDIQPSSFTETTLVPRDDMSDYGRSVISASTMESFVQDRELDLPPVPETRTTGKDFECPYCCTIVPAKTGSEKAWR